MTTNSRRAERDEKNLKAKVLALNALRKASIKKKGMDPSGRQRYQINHGRRTRRNCDLCGDITVGITGHGSSQRPGRAGIGGAMDAVRPSSVCQKQHRDRYQGWLETK